MVRWLQFVQSDEMRLVSGAPTRRVSEGPRLRVGLVQHNAGYRPKASSKAFGSTMVMRADDYASRIAEWRGSPVALRRISGSCSTNPTRKRGPSLTRRVGKTLQNMKPALAIEPFLTVIVAGIADDGVDMIGPSLRGVFDDERGAGDAVISGAAVGRRPAPGEVGVGQFRLEFRHPDGRGVFLYDVDPLADHIQQH